MEEKSKKISLKEEIVIILAVLVDVFAIIWFIYYMQVTITKSSITIMEGDTATTMLYSDTFKIMPIISNTKYNSFSFFYNGDAWDEISLDNIFVTSKGELITYLTIFGFDLDEITIDNKEIKEYFDDSFFENNNLAIQMYDTTLDTHHYSIASVTVKKSKAHINIKDECYSTGFTTITKAALRFIELDKSITSVDFDIYRTTAKSNYFTDNSIIFILLMSGICISIMVIIITSTIIKKHNRKLDEVENEKEHNRKLDEVKNEKKPKFKKILIIVILVVIVLYFLSIYYIYDTVTGGIYKPIIYLYPTETTEVSVKLKNSENITVSYPKYTTGWNVLANTDGTLMDLTTRKNLYALYYESTNIYKFDVTNEGFIVRGEEVTEFLEDKLAILGLTEREAEEFIIYWLPILQENEYNYIRFAEFEEIEENMPLEIEPNPDTIIRVLMIYKGLDEPIEVEEQNLITPERTGFVAVEWGGTEIE